MSDYTSTFTKTTGQTIEASDFSTEFDAIETVSATKADESGATLTTTTLTSPKINEILDANGNELVKFTTTGSAVNEVTLANAATGNNPTLTASGGDTNIGINLVPKGSGEIQVSGVAIPRMTLDTPVATTSGTTANFTSIPSWVKRITVSFQGLSTNGTSALLVQIGDSGGIEATNYIGACANVRNAAATVVTTLSSGFMSISFLTAATNHRGVLILTLLDSTNNIWSCTGTGYNDTLSTQLFSTNGTKALSATLDRVRLTTVSSDTFDAGSVNILYEG